MSNKQKIVKVLEAAVERYLVKNPVYLTDYLTDGPTWLGDYNTLLRIFSNEDLINFRELCEDEKRIYLLFMLEFVKTDF